MWTLLLYLLPRNLDFDDCCATKKRRPGCLLFAFWHKIRAALRQHRGAIGVRGVVGIALEARSVYTLYVHTYVSRPNRCMYMHLCLLVALVTAVVSVFGFVSLVVRLASAWVKLSRDSCLSRPFENYCTVLQVVVVFLIVLNYWDGLEPPLCKFLWLLNFHEKRWQPPIICVLNVVAGWSKPKRCAALIFRHECRTPSIHEWVCVRLEILCSNNDARNL